MVKKILYLLPVILLLELFHLPLPSTAAYFPGSIWRTVDNPEEAGWSSKKLTLVQQAADKMDCIGGMVLHDGKIVCKWGDITKRGALHSARKSLLSALYGIYVSEGKIDLNRNLGQLGIDDKEPRLSRQEKQARVIDLLKARSGVYHVAAAEPASMKEKRPERGSHAPDTFWYYNNWDFNALGVIFEKLTREKIGAAFNHSIADLTGMQDFRTEDVGYSYVKESLIPAFHFNLTARDMARFGLLYSQNGRWLKKQVVASDWVAESTRAYSDAARGVGYGYMWWVAKERILGTKIDFPGYWAWGLGGQYIIVFPTKNLVVANLSKVHEHDHSGTKEFAPFLKLVLTDNPN